MWWIVSAAWATAGLRVPPAGFVDLRDAVPGVRLEIGYHTDSNFTGGPLPGYGAPGAWLRADAAVALAAVQAALAEEGLGLVVYDAYRPKRASAAMVAWAERTGQQWVLSQGYVAKHSGHNRGNTVDVSVFRLSDGQPVDMGGPWDAFAPVSHTRGVTGAALDSRLALSRAMQAQGWRPYSKEWWHFRFPMDSAAPRDVPYSCFEPAEGQWTAPEGWTAPGYTAPPWPESVACD